MVKPLRSIVTSSLRDLDAVLARRHGEVAGELVAAGRLSVAGKPGASPGVMPPAFTFAWSMRISPSTAAAGPDQKQRMQRRVAAVRALTDSGHRMLPSLSCHGHAGSQSWDGAGRRPRRPARRRHCCRPGCCCRSRSVAADYGPNPKLPLPTMTLPSTIAPPADSQMPMYRLPVMTFCSIRHRLSK